MFHFGIIKTPVPDKVGRKLDRIASKHGALFTWGSTPGSDVQGWFEGPNHGFPFDLRLSRAVMRDIQLACRESRSLNAFCIASGLSSLWEGNTEERQAG